MLVGMGTLKIRLIWLSTFSIINFSTSRRTTEFLNSKVENGPNTYKQQILINC